MMMMMGKALACACLPKILIILFSASIIHGTKGFTFGLTSHHTNRLFSNKHHYHSNKKIDRNRQQHSTSTASLLILTATKNDERIASDDFYRKFSQYAMEKLESNGSISTSFSPSQSSSVVPSDLSEKVAPVKKRGGSNKSTETEETTQTPIISSSIDIQVKGFNGNNDSNIRYVRYALLETITTKKDSNDDIVERMTSKSGTNVLNFVIFPSADKENIPIFGADLVTLPGNKHLIVIDFQPCLLKSNHLLEQLEDGEIFDDTDTTTPLLSLPNHKILEKLQHVYEKHVTSQKDELPWGGDIPDYAKRFFSPFALWTRLSGENAVDLIETKVYNAFVDYLDLYLEILEGASLDNAEEETVYLFPNDANNEGNDRDDVVVVNNEQMKHITMDDLVDGHTSYLNYRKQNDPARPMLKSLYGEEWTERLINEVLFKPLE